MSKSKFVLNKYFKFAFAGLLAVAFIAAQPSTTAQAKTKSEVRDNQDSLDAKRIADQY